MPNSFTYNYPRPMVTVDLVVFGLSEEGLRSLFIRRKKDPFAGRWAIPGGYLEMDETFEAGARRELAEEATLSELGLVREIGTFGAPGRDPRGRTISVAHAGIVRAPLPPVSGGDDAAEAAWLDPDAVGELAFDHADILASARRWLASGLAEGRFVFDLLPKVFTERDVAALLQIMPGRRKSLARWMRDALKTQTIESVDASEGRFRETINT
jgi:8-oxo-dGTP diphosphatase